MNLGLFSPRYGPISGSALWANERPAAAPARPANLARAFPGRASPRSRRLSYVAAETPWGYDGRAPQLNAKHARPTSERRSRPLSSRRLRKKLHKRALAFEIVDLSWDTAWRQRLLGSAPWSKLPITAQSPDLPARARSALSRHRLRFTVQKVPSEDRRDLWLEPSFAIFRFEALEFPEVWIESGNNPDSP